ncbi:MAG: phosphoglycerate dehydrogenase [Planctomycetes bacterium]|jgi:D-3-phosphoglycerate dehydrogenase|nr:phosphoglycerate dehydrogenase [Planctomycetota bacterium]
MPEKPTVLVTEQLQTPAMDYLHEHAEVIEATPETVADHIGQADGLVVRTYTIVHDELLDKAPTLKVVGRAGVALDNIDVPACRARGVEVVHTPAANTLAVVDYVTYHLVAMNRRFWPFSQAMSGEEFHATRKQTYGRFLADCTLGIIGVGRIGSRVGRIAQAMRMRVWGNDILPPEALDVDYPIEWASFDEVLAASDIVTIHVPLTDETRRFIDAAAIAKMTDGVQFINAARGGCVDYDALGEALRSGKVADAVIDCHHPEPPPVDYALLGLDNATLTPHVAACVPKAKLNMSMVVTDVLAVIDGRQPEYPAAEGTF